MHRPAAALAAILSAALFAACGSTTADPRHDAESAARAYLTALADGDYDGACERVVSREDNARAAEDFKVQLVLGATGSAVLDATGPCPQALRVFVRQQPLGDLRFETLTARRSGEDYWIGTGSDVPIAHALLMREYDDGWKIVAFG